MKPTGIIRRIDDLGRVVIPKEVRRTLRIREGDPLEIFIDDQGGAVFRKYSPLGITDNVLRIANLMAKFAGIEIAIYDMSYKLTGDLSYPVNTPEAWGDFYRPMQFENYIVYPILCDGERYGFVCSCNALTVEITMIVRYIAAALSN